MPSDGNFQDPAHRRSSTSSSGSCHSRGFNTLNKRASRLESSNTCYSVDVRLVLPPSSCSRSTTPKQNTLDISGTRTGFLLAFLVVEITIIAVVVIIMDRDLVTKESIFEVIQEEEDIIVVDIAVEQEDSTFAEIHS
eukprot:scaffold3846_cov291-Chaetoceros_neogracile.AAC.1